MKIDTTMKQLLFVTVHIETVTPKGKSTGTGFIYDAYRVGSPAQLPVLVTNKHVIENGTRAYIRFILREGDQPRWGQGVVVQLDELADAFVGHPDKDVDVTAMFVGPLISQMADQGQSLFYQAIPSSLIPTDEQLNNLDVVMSVTFIGYPNSLYDTKNLTPIVRRGFTATPIQLDWKGEPCFLIDASVFPGSSGSPVFLAEFGSYTTPAGVVIGSRIHFLGVVSAVHQQPSLASIIAKSVPGISFNQMIDLGIVYNWRAVEQTVDALCDKYSIDRNVSAPPQELQGEDVKAEKVEGQSGIDATTDNRGTAKPGSDN